MFRRTSLRKRLNPKHALIWLLCVLMLCPPFPLARQASATTTSTSGKTEAPTACQTCGDGNPSQAGYTTLGGGGLTTLGGGFATMGGGGGYGSPAVSDNSIYLMRASAAQCVTDISQPGPVGVWEHTRSTDSGFPESTTGRSEQWDLGGTTGWYLESIGGDSVELFQSAASMVTFDLWSFDKSFNAVCTPSGIDATMTKRSFVMDSDDLDNDGNTFEFIDLYEYTEHSTGNFLVFLGFSFSTASHYQGRMVEKSTVAYQEANLSGTTIAYDTNSNVTVVTTPEPQSSRIDYSYVYTGSTNQVDTIEVRDGPLATDTVIKKAEYTYYNELTSPDTGLGNNDDLVQVKRSELASDGTNWIESLTQYRYYRDSSSDGRAHQIKMEFDAHAIERAIAAEISISSAADMLEASDSTVESYASKSYTYYTEDIATDNSGTTKCVTPWSTSSGENLQSKYVASGATVSEFDEFNTTEDFGAVKTLSIGPGTVSCCGGSSVSSVRRTYHYINLNGGTSTNPAQVVRLVIEDTEDGADPRNAIYRKVYGLNDKGIAIREAFIEDPTVSTLKVWCESSNHTIIAARETALTTDAVTWIGSGCTVIELTARILGRFECGDRAALVLAICSIVSRFTGHAVLLLGSNKIAACVEV